MNPNNNNRNVDAKVRISCFLCDAYRFPWAILQEHNEWVCRQCINYEGNRLPYSINNTRFLKNAIKDTLGLRLQPVGLSSLSTGQEIPVIVTLPPNYSCVNSSATLLPPLPNPSIEKIERSQPPTATQSTPDLTDVQPNGQITTTVTRTAAANANANDGPLLLTPVNRSEFED